ncbi:MAG TPA: FHA domain-containing protein, partial [Chthonomonadales bacterium]|nr:FHA domain-containing protein [Chthonomonadales bacterium]
GAHEEAGTVPSVAAAALVVYPPDKQPYRYAVSGAPVNIGRAGSAGNDIIVDSDGQMSKRHARIELDADGRFTIYDLGSTNGVRVNGRRIDNRTLNDGDEILLGATRLLFQCVQAEPLRVAHAEEEPALQNGRSGGSYGGAAARHSRQADGSSSPPARMLRSRMARVIIMDGSDDIDDYLLASETSIGRAVTNDIVLPDRSVATRHLRIVHDGDGYLMENLAGEMESTGLNGAVLPPGATGRLKDGDRIQIGRLTMRFAEKE